MYKKYKEIAKFEFLVNLLLLYVPQGYLPLILE